MYCYNSVLKLTCVVQGKLCTHIPSSANRYHKTVIMMCYIQELCGG